MNPNFPFPPGAYPPPPGAFIPPRGMPMPMMSGMVPPGQVPPFAMSMPAPPGMLMHPGLPAGMPHPTGLPLAGNVIVGAPVMRAPVMAAVAPGTLPGGHWPPPMPMLATAAAPPHPLMITPLTLYIGLFAGCNLWLVVTEF